MPAIILLASGSAAYAQRPTISFTLHRSGSHASSLWVGPDGSLLTMSMDGSEQPGDRWEIRRITNWESRARQEQALTIETGYGKLPPNHELVNLSGERVFMDPAGRYLVVRIDHLRGGAWSQGRTLRSSTVEPPVAILDVVDLSSFKEVAHRVVADPVLAAGGMGFNAHGALVAEGLAEHTGSTAGDVYTDTGQYKIESVRLPELQTDTVCQYSRVVRELPVMTRFNRDEQRRREEFDRENQARKLDEMKSANAACSAKLAPLGYSSVENVESELSEVKQEFRIERMAAKVELHPGYGCNIEDVSTDRKYMLFDCDQSRVQLTFLSYYRGRQVYNIGTGQRVLEIRLAHSPSVSGVITAAGGKDYLVLLRDGRRVEAYPLP